MLRPFALRRKQLEKTSSQGLQRLSVELQRDVAMKSEFQFARPLLGKRLRLVIRDKSGLVLPSRQIRLNDVQTSLVLHQLRHVELCEKGQ